MTIALPRSMLALLLASSIACGEVEGRVLIDNRDPPEFRLEPLEAGVNYSVTMAGVAESGSARFVARGN